MTRKINTRVKKQKGMLVRDRTTTKNTERIGKGVIDTHQSEETERQRSYRYSRKYGSIQQA